MDSTPDTGCTITLLNLDVALRNGIHIDRTKKVELYHTAGGSIHVEGMANIRVCANNIQEMLQVAVSSELKETMFISCDNLRKLCVIPADFPNAVLTVKKTIAVRAEDKAHTQIQQDTQRRTESLPNEMCADVNYIA